MNQKQFLYELWRELERIPIEEREEAMRYYEEYLEDAQGNEQAIHALGTPKEVAAQILGDYAVKGLQKPAKSTKQGLSKVWLIILAIFASPIALPLAVAIAAVALVLVIAAVAVMVALCAAGLGAVLGGIAVIIAGCWVLVASPASAVFFVGIGAFAVGLGLLIGLFSVWLGRISVSGIGRALGRFLNRHRKAPNGLEGE